MPQDLRIRVGTIEATIPLGGTPAQVTAFLERYARGMGIELTGTQVENLTTVAVKIREEVKRVSKRVHRQDLEQANLAAIEAALAEDDVVGVSSVSKL